MRVWLKRFWWLVVILTTVWVGGLVWFWLDKRFVGVQDKSKETSFVTIARENLFGRDVEVASLVGRLASSVWMDKDGRQFFDFEVDNGNDEKVVFNVLVSHGRDYEPEGEAVIYINKGSNQSRRYKYEDFVDYINQAKGKRAVLKTILVSEDLWNFSLSGFAKRGLGTARPKMLKNDLFCTAEAIRTTNFGKGCRWLLYFYDLKLD